MDGRYIKSNIFPIILEILFVPACLIFKGYHIYINFFVLYDTGGIFLPKNRF